MTTNHRMILLALLALGLSVGAALPHASVIRTSPQANGAVQSPREVSILFSERVQAPTIVVQDANGTRADNGDARLDSNGRVARTSLKPGLSAGSYRVNWSIRSADGHTAQGNFAFRVR